MTNFEMDSSPPFFLGSPPSRVPNPLIQDAQFGNDNFVPILAIPEGAPAPPPSFTSTCGRNNRGGCVPVKFGIKPAAVRIEGFNCCSSISAVAQVNHIAEVIMKITTTKKKILKSEVFGGDMRNQTKFVLALYIQSERKRVAMSYV